MKRPTRVALAASAAALWMATAAAPAFAAVIVKGGAPDQIDSPTRRVARHDRDELFLATG